MKYIFVIAVCLSWSARVQGQSSSRKIADLEKRFAPNGIFSADTSKNNLTPKPAISRTRTLKDLQKMISPGAAFSTGAPPKQAAIKKDSKAADLPSAFSTAEAANKRKQAASVMPVNKIPDAIELARLQYADSAAIKKADAPPPLKKLEKKD
ncbi:hypothetical protein [Foetidibacter luteolus]|uniref:hypothetical protein n=1 Tax=Foetidibacter luteolus TaxID=2608880 RepID=UPI00129A9F5B|nr:hypothetical protein [Foetidibacter luteolus]